MGSREVSALMFVLAIWLVAAGLVVCWLSGVGTGGVTLATATTAAGLAFRLMRE